MRNIAIVVPTIRQESMEYFESAWADIFKKHNVTLIWVLDGETPKLMISDAHQPFGPFLANIDLPKNIRSNHCAGVRNYGFAFIAKKMRQIEYIITLDDDETPIGDPIQDHIDQLSRKVPISWFSTTIGMDYMRGFPYGVRNEAPVMLSHGVWEGVYDWDAPTQLLNGNKAVEFYKGPIPMGALFPMCGMNLAFKREMLPYMYFAPVGEYKGAERFDDIWAGIEIKKDLDRLGWAAVTGYAKCQHERASNVFENLKKEVLGIAKNEEYWQGEYDEWYESFLNKRKTWYNYITND